MTETSEEIWFVLLQGEELGPLSFEEVLDFYYKDVITSESLIWRDGLEGWLPIIHVSEFNELLFQGVIIQDSQSQIGGEDTAFIDHNSLSAAVFQNASNTVDVDESVEEFEDLEEFVSMGGEDEHTPARSVSENEQVLSPQFKLTAKPKKKSSSLGMITLLIALLGGGAFVLKPWDNHGLVHEEKPQLSKVLGKTQKAEEVASVKPINDFQLPTPRVVTGQAETERVVAEGSSDENSNVNTSSGLNTQVSLELPQVKQERDPDQGVPSSQEELKAGIEELAVVESELEIETTIEIEESKPQKSLPRTDRTKKSKSKAKGDVSKRKPKPQRPNRSRKRNGQSKRSKEGAAKAKKIDTRKVPVTLRRGDMTKVVKKSRSAFEQCLKSDRSLSGTVNVMVVIERNGKVSSARPTSSKLRKSPANSCVISAVRNLKFPAYSGDLLRVPLPIKL